jgi:two-component system response regulator EvgA
MKIQSLLIIEDHAALRQSLQSWLIELYTEITIYEAATGEDGLSIALSKSPDLMLVDIGLPGIDGLEVIEYVRENNVKSKIIVLTIQEGMSYQKASIKAGADAFINKKDMYIKLPQVIDSILK